MKTIDIIDNFGELDNVRFETRDQYIEYFDFIKTAFNRLMDSLKSRSSDNPIEIAILKDFMQKYLNTVEILRLKYLFDTENKMAIDLSDSSFPNYLEIRKLDSHKEKANETLKKLPEGTVGRAYVNFMEREGLTAAGLVAESEKWYDGESRYEDDLAFYETRMRDTHDLLHVLTGYGRDQLGETSVLAFSHGHNGGFGNLFIAHIGSRDLAKASPKSAKVTNSVKEARRNGRDSLPLMEEDIVALLREPLADARKRLNIKEPLAYKYAISRLNDIGYDGQLSAA